jgi:hypothetical protein
MQRQAARDKRVAFAISFSKNESSFDAISRLNDASSRCPDAREPPGGLAA